MTGGWGAAARRLVAGRTPEERTGGAQGQAELSRGADQVILSDVVRRPVNDRDRDTNDLLGTAFTGLAAKRGWDAQHLAQLVRGQTGWSHSDCEFLVRKMLRLVGPNHAELTLTEIAVLSEVLGCKVNLQVLANPRLLIQR